MKNREINSQIAEKVMGWKLANSGGWLSQEQKKGWLGKEGRVIYDSSGLFKWSPSTNIAQAFEVLPVMREKGFYFHITDTVNKDEWFATFTTANNPFGYRGEASTPALAICLAALGVELGKDGTERNQSHRMLKREQKNRCEIHK